MMLPKSTSHLTILVLITSLIGFPHLASGQPRDSSLQPVPVQERFDPQNVSSEFLSRLKDHRSVVLRKESVSKRYAQIEKFLKDSQQRKEEVDRKLATINSTYDSAQDFPDHVVDQLSVLAPRSKILSIWVQSGTALLDLLVEEYDVLSRLEEVEKKYKAKAISKLDYVSEERRLAQELSQLGIARQLEDLSLRLADGLHDIESKLNRLRTFR